MLPIRSFFLMANLALITTSLASQEHHAAVKCTVCAPQLSLDAAALWRTREQLPSLGADRTVALLRARFTASTALSRLGIFSTMEFTPEDGPSPTITGGLQLSMLPPSSKFTVTGGLGFIDARQGVGESSPGQYVARGWGEIGLQYQTPVHELSLYGQAGAAFSGSRRVSYQIGLSHPLAPYTFHAVTP